MGMIHYGPEPKTVAVRKAREHLEGTIAKRAASAKGLMERIFTDVPEDKLVPTPKLTFATQALDEDDGRSLEARRGVIQIDDREVSIRKRLLVGTKSQREQGAFLRPMHSNALQQVADKTNIGSRFLNTFLGKEYGPDLIAEVLNTVIDKEPPNRWLMRSVHDEVRGVMSDTYRIMDSRPIIEAFWKTATDLGAVPFEGTGGDLRWSLRAVIPHVFQPAEDEVLAIVVHLANSDFGKGALTLALEVERILCTNLMTGKNELRKVHLGARLQEGVAYELDTQYADTSALSLVIRDHVKGVLAPPRVEETMTRIKSAIDDKIDIKNAFTKELPKYGLRKKEVEAARDIYMNGAIEDLPRGDNRYRVANALSWIAQHFPEIQPERRMELERTAGKYLFGDGKAGEED